MVRLRIKELMEERGIKHPFTALCKLGITHAIAQKYISGEKRWIILAHVEKLCLFLRCTPNDLFEWVPDGQTVADKEHPLHRVKPRKPFKVEDELKKLTPDEIRKLFEKDDEEKKE